MRQASYRSLTREVARMSRIENPFTWHLRVVKVEFHIARLRMTVARLKLQTFWRYVKRKVAEETVKAWTACIETGDRLIYLTTRTASLFWLGLRSAGPYAIAMLQTGIENSVEGAKLAFSQFKCWWRDLEIENRVKGSKLAFSQFKSWWRDFRDK
jgi:hypothetical protein